MKRQLWITDRRDDVVFLRMADPFVAERLEAIGAIADAGGISYHQASDLALGVLSDLKKKKGRDRDPARRD